MPIRVGFLIGKDTDLVEDAKYVGNASFLKDMPDKFRVDPESKEYLKDCEEGTKGFAHADVAIPWFMHKHHEDIEDRMQGHITGALSSIEEMAQIVTVPVSQEYSRHTSRFLTVYVLILPFALIELGHLMPVAVTVTAWALLSIEEIGHTLEDPFNSPTQRLDLTTKPLNVQAYLEQPLGFEPLMEAQRPFESVPEDDLPPSSEIEVDMIFPDEISTQRLKSNVCNFVIGYDVINTMFENEARQKSVTKAFKQCGNIMPSWKVQDFIYIKSKYMNACLKAGIPMAPTIFAFKGKRTPAKLLKEIKARGWKSFVMKQSMMAFSLGFCKLSVEECEKDPSILKKYFKEYAECPEYVVQECIDGFTRNWETRVFWFNGEFLYAIANKAAVSTEDGTEVIVTGDDIPEEFLENAKRIGKEALKVLPQLTAPTGESIPMTLIRTDIGCSDSQVFDKDTKWDPNSRTFFLNEIEYGGTTYFIRHLKEDFVPKWADLYANKAREIAALQKEEAIEEPEKKRPRTGTMKKPASAKASAAGA